MEDDSKFMRLAIALAKQAEKEGEVPVGAILVRCDEIVASGYNQVIKKHDPTAHAEMEALRLAGSVVNNYRLKDLTLYVTLEPCPMCAGAIIHSRLERVVFGAFDKRIGAAGSAFEILGNSKLNHRPSVVGGIEAIECGELLKAFFRKKRGKPDDSIRGKFHEIVS